MADALHTHRDHTGQVRKLGNVPPPPGFPLALKRAPLLIPEDHWQEFDLRGMKPTPIKDQGQTGSCNGHAAATSLEWARMVSGQPPVALSPWFIYSILCGGVDRGSSIAEALDLLTKTGTCPFDAVPYGVINPRKLTPDAKAQAGRFKVEVGASLTTFAELMSAAQLRRFGNFSLHVGANFDRFTDEGVVGYSRGAGNHAICFGMAAKRLKSGQWALAFENSWGNWADGGFAWFTAQHIDGQPYFEAYDVLAPTEDPSDSDTPPPAP